MVLGVLEEKSNRADVLLVNGAVGGVVTGVALDTCASVSMVGSDIMACKKDCVDVGEVDCIQAADPMRILGVGGSVVVSDSTITTEAKLVATDGPPVTVSSEFRVVPPSAIPIPGAGALVNYEAIRRLGIVIGPAGASVDSSSLDEPVLGGCCASECNHACVSTVDDDSFAKFVDHLETAGEMLFVPPSAEWSQIVTESAQALLSVESAEQGEEIMSRALEYAEALAAPPVMESAIRAQARPCVSAQVLHKLGDGSLLDERLQHERARPAQVLELKSDEVIGAPVAVAYTGSSALQFNEAHANTPVPTASQKLFGPPALVDQQADVDFDSFCVPPLDPDPAFDAKWWAKVKEPLVNGVLCKEAKKLWLDLMSQPYVKDIFRYDLSNIKLSSMAGVAPIKLHLRPDAEIRFEPERWFSKEDIAFAGPVEDGLIRAGFLREATQEELGKLQYVSQPLIPKQLQEDKSIKRRYAVDFKPTVNLDLQVPKGTQWDTREWHFQDHDVVLRSVLDGKMWYFQFGLDPASQILTAQNLISKEGIYVSTGLQLGLSPAPGECIKRNAIMFYSLGHKEFRSAMDELIAMSRGPALTDELQIAHIKLLERLFIILHRHGAKCSLEKAQFLQSVVRLMGVEHGPGEIRIPEAKVKAIRDWPFPTGRQVQKQLDSVIQGWRWLANQGFASDFALKMLPCKALPAGTSVQEREAAKEQCEKAFAAMKAELADNVGVQNFDPNLRAVVSGDWSRLAMGGTLSQIRGDGIERPVAVASRGCTNTEAKLKSAEGELTVMAWLIDEKWGRFLVHNWFWYVADQQSLTELVEYLGKDEPRRFYIYNLVRSLARFTFYVVARPGKFMPLNDALSRTNWEQQMSIGTSKAAASQAALTNPLWKSSVAAAVVGASNDFRTLLNRYMARPDVLYQPVRGLTSVSAVAVPVHTHGHQLVDEADSRLWTVSATEFDFDELVRNCPEIRAIRALMRGTPLKSLDGQGLSPEFVLALNGYRGRDRNFSQFFEMNGRLCHRTTIDGKDIAYERLYIPCSNPDVQLRSRLIFEAHNSDLAAHRKDDKTVALLQRNYFWMTMRSDVELWNAGCACRLQFGNGRRKVGPLGAAPMGDGLWDQVNIDYFGPLATGRFGGHTGLLVISYPKSGRVIPVAVRSKDAAEIALKFVDKAIIGAPTQPRTVVSDNGTEFVNSVLRNVEKLAQMRHITVAVENPKANTYVERPNRWIKSALQVMLLGLSPDFWDHKAIRQALKYLGGRMVSRTRGVSPVFLETGVDSLNGLDLVLSDFAPKPQDKTLADRFAMMRRARAWAAFSQREASEKARVLHDSKIAPNKLEVGNRVWVRIPEALRHSKLDTEYMGPYVLLEWVQKERRSAWVGGLDNEEEFRVPVDHIIPDRGVPDRLKLNFVPFELPLDHGPMANSIVKVVEQELAERDAGFEGHFDSGDSFDPHAEEPGFVWPERYILPSQSDGEAAGIARRAQLDKELQEQRRVHQMNLAVDAAQSAAKVRQAKATALVPALGVVVPKMRRLQRKDGAALGVAPPALVMGPHIPQAVRLDADLALDAKLAEQERAKVPPVLDVQVGVSDGANPPVDVSPVDEDSEPVYELEAIVEHHTVGYHRDGGTIREYWVKFVGYGVEDNLWLSEHDLSQSAPQLLKEYEDSLTGSRRSDFAVSKKKDRHARSKDKG